MQNGTSQKTKQAADLHSTTALLLSKDNVEDRVIGKFLEAYKDEIQYCIPKSNFNPIDNSFFYQGRWFGTSYDMHEGKVYSWYRQFDQTEYVKCSASKVLLVKFAELLISAN
jgi:hypothetical protein